MFTSPFTIKILVKFEAHLCIILMRRLGQASLTRLNTERFLGFTFVRKPPAYHCVGIQMPSHQGKRVGCTSRPCRGGRIPLHGLVEEALREGGFETAILSSGEEALTLFRGKVAPHRALVTDVNLKGALARHRARTEHYRDDVFVPLAARRLSTAP